VTVAANADSRAPGTTGTAVSATARSTAGSLRWYVTGQVQAMLTGGNHEFLRCHRRLIRFGEGIAGWGTTMRDACRM
jgi:hypothetical protein